MGALAFSLVVGGLAGLVVALDLGFPEPVMPPMALRGALIGLSALYALRVVLRAARLQSWRKRVRVLSPDLAAVGVVVVLVTFDLIAEATVEHAPHVAERLWLHALVGVRICIGLVRTNLRIAQTSSNPARVFVGAFLVLIVLGGLVLALPSATTREIRTAEGNSTGKHLLNCMFTSTSAVCVTGLIVYDTPVDFTRFGHVVILVLMQLGGLGITIFGSLFALLAGRSLSLRQSMMLQDELSHRTMGEMRSVILFVVVFTFVAEAIGAAILFPMFADVPTLGDRVFHSVFHAVSAFCNAGFALQSDSFIRLQRAWPVYVGIMPLIILGGLGFPVLRQFFRQPRIPVTPGSGGRRPFNRASLPTHVSLHAKIVLVTTIMLILGGAGLFFLFESFAAERFTGAGTSMGSADAGGRFLDALFLSVTCRTAGFNTVDMSLDSLSPASHMLAVILMFVGGSPASTAGGVKTITISLLLLEIWATLRGRAAVEVFHRRVPESSLRRAGVVVVLMFAVVSLVTLSLSFTEQAPLRAVLFEAVSACGTVGLSTGITPGLTTAGRIIIMIAMVAGRLGPLSVLVALTGPAGAPRYAYPREDVAIG